MKDLKQIILETLFSDSSSHSDLASHVSKHLASNGVSHSVDGNQIKVHHQGKIEHSSDVAGHVKNAIASHPDARGETTKETQGHISHGLSRSSEGRQRYVSNDTHRAVVHDHGDHSVVHLGNSSPRYH